MEILKTNVNKTYQYDELDRLISVTFENGKQIFYSYDVAGNRTLVSSSKPTEPLITPERPNMPITPVFPEQQVTCSTCGSVIPAGSQFCNRCGGQIQPAVPKSVQQRFCPKCGAVRRENKLFCAKCGYNFNK